MTLIKWSNGKPECWLCWSNTKRDIPFQRVDNTTTFRCPECGKEFDQKEHREDFQQYRVGVNLGMEHQCNLCGSQFCVCPERQGDGEWKTERDCVNHPHHYTQGKIECIDFIEDQKMGFHLGNAIKYIVRAPFKGTAKQDIQKAIWYLNRYLDTL